MQYLNKCDVLKAYKVLSCISPDPNLQGATQKVSAIRYALALDMFCHNQKTTVCDTKIKDAKELFATYVGRVCAVSSDLYTTNFYCPLKPHTGDLNVGSNFYSVGQVKISLADPTSMLDYPKRGNAPLFHIKNGILIKDTSLYYNLNAYLNNAKVKAALVIWILRDIELTASMSTFNMLSNALTELMSAEIIGILMPETTGFKQEINNIITLPLSSSPAKLEEEDIAKLFNQKEKNVYHFSKYRQYITAIKSKPFVLLAGISGTGKSRIVRELARACWDTDSAEYEAQKPSNFEMVQVKPNWHDSSELLGYVSRISGEDRYIAGDFLRFVTRAWENWLGQMPMPFFLCLDEMNLAPVEQYFAEYLSVIESRRLRAGAIRTDPLIRNDTEGFHDLIDRRLAWKSQAVHDMFEAEGICLPPNLIVVGTVNMDETTFSFSRKVLDRAMAIEMNEVDLTSGLTSAREPISRQSAATLIGTAAEAADVYADHREACDACLQYLNGVNAVLDGTPFKVAYRTRNETLLYVVNNLPYDRAENGETLPQGYVIARALDEITSMKILSRIEGDETRVSLRFLDALAAAIAQGLSAIAQRRYGPEALLDEGIPVERSVALAKLATMTEKLRTTGYTSYWS